MSDTGLIDNTKLIKAFIICLPLIELEVYFTYLAFNIVIDVHMRFLVYGFFLFKLMHNKTIAKRDAFKILGFVAALMTFYSLINFLLGTYDLDKVVMLGKYMSYTAIFYLIYCIRDTIDFEEVRSAIDIVIVIIFTVFMIATFTSTGQFTYRPENKGHSAWFIEGNDTSIILSLLFMTAVFQYVSKPGIYLKAIPHIMMIVIPGFMIGTKTPFLTVAATFVVFAVHEAMLIIHYIPRASLRVFGAMVLDAFKKVTLLLGVFVVCIVIANLLLDAFPGGVYTGPPVPVNSGLPFFTINFEIIETASNAVLDQISAFDLPGSSNAGDRMGMFDGFLTKLLSGRNLRFADNNVIYSSNLIITVLFGSFATPVLFEMDFFDIFYNFGLVGAILILFPMWVIFYSVFRHFKEYIIRREKFYFIYTFSMGFMLSTMVGHTFITPGVSIYVILLSYFSLHRFEKYLPNVPVISKRLNPPIEGA